MRNGPRYRTVSRGARLLCALLLATASGRALAHDTWFEPRPGAKPGTLVLALGTGAQFPVQESTVPQDHLDASGCLANGLHPEPLEGVADSPTALLLKGARPAAPDTPRSCWALLLPLLITIDDAVVPRYLQEVRASAAIRARWADMQSRGLRWTEVYTKHARFESDAAPPTPDGSAADTTTTPAIPTLGMDVRLTRPLGGLRAGDTLAAQVLRDGQPLAGQLIELRNNISPLGLWRQTDAQGRLTIPLPLAGRWLLRGVDLRPSDTDPNRWDSRFVTVAFEVQPRR